METDDLLSAALEIRILTAVTAKRAMHALRRRLNLADKGLTGLQYGIMQALHHEEQTISELSHKLMLDPSTLVPAVDALERKELARRGRDPQDRRRVPLSLTERGAEFVTCVPALDDDDPLVQSLNTMGEEKAGQLLALLREMVENMPEGKDIMRRVSLMMDAHAARESTLTE